MRAVELESRENPEKLVLKERLDLLVRTVTMVLTVLKETRVLRVKLLLDPLVNLARRFEIRETHSVFPLSVSHQL